MSHESYTIDPVLFQKVSAGVEQLAADGDRAGVERGRVTVLLQDFLRHHLVDRDTVSSSHKFEIPRDLVSLIYYVWREDTKQGVGVEFGDYLARLVRCCDRVEDNDKLLLHIVLATDERDIPVHVEIEDLRWLRSISITR